MLASTQKDLAVLKKKSLFDDIGAWKFVVYVLRYFFNVLSLNKQ